VPDKRLQRTRVAYLERTTEDNTLRRFLGLTPHIPEGQATYDALVPNRYKAHPADAGHESEPGYGAGV
jgi:hypothetical protein